MLLKHFNQNLPSDIGGYDQCCDNCRRKLVYLMKVVMYTHTCILIIVLELEMLWTVQGIRQPTLMRENCC